MRVEYFKRRNGRYGWRMRDEDGTLVKLPRPGKIHLPHDPEADERSRRAVQEALRQRYEAQLAAQG